MKTIQIKHFINYNAHILLGRLTETFLSVIDRSDATCDLWNEIKVYRGVRLRGEQLLTHPEGMAREQAYEAGILRLSLSNDLLFLALKELKVAIEAVDNVLQASNIGEFTPGREISIARNNVFWAKVLLDSCSTICYEFPNSPNFIGLATPAIEQMYQKQLVEGDGRDYVIKSSYGKSNYRYECEDGITPPVGPHMTFEEAKKAADRWIGYSNGVGDAVIENLTTGQFYTFDGRPVKGEF